MCILRMDSYEYIQSNVSIDLSFIKCTYLVELLEVTIDVNKTMISRNLLIQHVCIYTHVCYIYKYVNLYVNIYVYISAKKIIPYVNCFKEYYRYVPSVVSENENSVFCNFSK